MALAVVGGIGAGAAYGARGLLVRQAAQARGRSASRSASRRRSADRHWKKAYGDPVRPARPRRLDRRRARRGEGQAHARRPAGPRDRPRAGRSVRLRTAAVVGSESSMLAAQLASLPATYVPDVAVIVVGGNDVTHRVPVAESVRHLVAAVDDLRARGAEVVVGTCPDLGALRPVPQPLRALGSRASRQLAEAQRAARAGARCAGGVAGPRGGPVLHHQPRRDVQPRPLPPQRARLQADRQGDAPVGAGGAGRGAGTCRSGTTHPGSVGQVRVRGCARLLDEPARSSRGPPRRPAGCRTRPHPSRPVGRAADPKAERRQRLLASNLTELAIEFRTDKWGVHRYTPHYERHLQHLRRRVLHAARARHRRLQEAAQERRLDEDVALVLPAGHGSSASTSRTRRG